MYGHQRINDAVATAAAPGPAYTRAEFAAAAMRPHLSALLTQLRLDAGREGPLPDLPYRLFRAYAETGDRSGYEERYFERRRRLNSVAAVALIDGGTSAIRRLEDILWEICSEYSWAVPAHHRFNTTLGMGYDRCIDLFAAETAHALAEIVTLLAEEVDGPVVRRVHNEINRRVLSPFLDEPRARWWETATNNWAAVCAGAAGMAGLILEKDSLRSVALIERVQRILTSFLSGFGTDGGCSEGMDYWVYGYGYFVYYAHALMERTGLDLLTGTEHIAAFPAAIDLGKGRCVSFSDGSDRSVPPTGLISYLTRRLGVRPPHIARISDFDDDHCYRWAHLSRTILWSNAEVVDSPATEGVTWLPDLAWLIARSGNGVAFAAKGGSNDEPHNHLDVGSFLLAVGGEQLITDLGAGVYDADYFGTRRYDALHTSAAGHSVPRVGGVDQICGPVAAHVVEYVEETDRVALELDLSALYAGHPVRRRFEWDGTRLVLIDSFGSQTVDLVERFISRVKPCPGDDRIVWQHRGGSLTLHYEGEWDVMVERIDTLDHRAHPDTVYRLTLTGATAATHGFVFVVEPGR